MTFYSGFDPTASSLHVGSLVPLMAMAHLGARRAPADRACSAAARRWSAIPRARPSCARCSPRRRSRPTASASSRRCAACSSGVPDAAVVDNADWLLSAQLHRLPARHRPPLQRQPHAGRRGVQAAAREGPVVHRVQLPAPAGLRLPRAEREVRLHAADRRRRPVGQHRRRRRPHPARRAEAGLRPDLPAHHDGVGREDGQDGGGRRVARRRAHEPLRLLPVLRERRRPRRGALPQAVHAAAPRRDRAASRPSRAPSCATPRSCSRTA